MSADIWLRVRTRAEIMMPSPVDASTSENSSKATGSGSVPHGTPKTSAPKPTSNAASKLATKATPSDLPSRIWLRRSGAASRRRSVPISRSSRMPPALPSATIVTKKTVNPSEYWVLAGASSSFARAALANTTRDSTPTGGSGLHSPSA